MTISELTSTSAVTRALDEFDALGRDAFLDKYGFGPAREYFVRRGNRLYDSKAIVGAAFGHQFPHSGPLRPSEFSGGEATVQKKLEELGFEVVVVRHAGPGAPVATDNTAARADNVANAAELERAFHQRMIEIYQAAKAIGYNATRFLGMVSEHGGLETAQILLRANTVSDGYTALWERKRLDLTVEAVVLDPKWTPLFSETDLRVAAKRLGDYGYTGELPTL